MRWICLTRCILCGSWVENGALALHLELVHPGEPRGRGSYYHPAPTD